MAKDDIMTNPPPPEDFNRHWAAHRQAGRHGFLPIWTVYGRTTREYPGRYVARLWLTLPAPAPTAFVALGDSLKAVRDLLPPECTCLARSVGDAPAILETWL